MVNTQLVVVAATVFENQTGHAEIHNEERRAISALNSFVGELEVISTSQAAHSRRIYYYDLTAYPATQGWEVPSSTDKARVFDSVGFPNAVDPSSITAIRTLLTARDIWESDKESVVL